MPRDEDAVLELLGAFEAQAGDTLSAFEGMSEAAMRHALAHVPALRNPFPEGLPPYAVLVELSSAAARRPGDGTLDNVLEAVVTQLAERQSAPLTDVRFGPPERFWALRHSLSEGLRATGPVVGFDLSFRRSDVMAFRRVAIAQLATSGLRSTKSATLGISRMAGSISIWCVATKLSRSRIGSKRSATACWIWLSVISGQASAANMALAARTNTPMINTYRQPFSSIPRPSPRCSAACRPLRFALDRGLP